MCAKSETSKCWLAVFCKPLQESIAEENLRQQGFNAYLPRIQRKRRNRGKWADAVEALFPRYVFIQVDPSRNSIAPVRSTRGVVELVRFGGQPAIVADEVMEALFQHADPDSGLHQDERSRLQAGDGIHLIEGPLAGMEGVFTQKDGEGRVTVLLDLLGKANRIAVSRDWVARVA